MLISWEATIVVFDPSVTSLAGLCSYTTPLAASSSSKEADWSTVVQPKGQNLGTGKMDS